MIFATVGTQLPFDRLVATLDQWAAGRPQKSVVAQIGDSSYQPLNIQGHRFLEPGEYQDLLQRASLIVAHAGIGSIITAVELGKPVIVMPRLAHYGEHRNDHQLATAQRFAQMKLVKVAFDEHELMRLLDEVDGLASDSMIASHAPKGLLQRLNHFITLEN